MPHNAHAESADAVRDLLRKAELAGAQRRALLLHTDRLPTAVGRPHHQRLARAALGSLAHAGRAQHFELSRGRLAIIWRGRDGRELETTLAALDHLMADLPPEQAVPRGLLVSLYDLPEQGAWLLDELHDPPVRHADEAPPPSKPIDAFLLTRLENALAQADLSRFMRWRKVLHLGGPAPITAWDERYVAASDVAANLCPEYRIKANPWLFHRLTRIFDRRMLTLSTGAQALGTTMPFALHLNVASMLSAEFLRFDAALPASLRGAVTLNLLATDILADPTFYAFAANFARTRGFRLLLRAASPALLALLNAEAAGLDYVQVKLTPELEADPESLRKTLPRGVAAVLTGVDTQLKLDWARAQGFLLVREK